MGSHRIVTRLILAAAAAAGVVAGHAATYLVTFRDGPGRQAAMQVAGHTHWAEMVAAGVMLGVLAVAIVVLRHVRYPSGQGTLPRSPLALVLWLAVIQSSLFIALEVGERLAAGWSAAAFASHSFVAILVVGLLVQVMVACLAGLLLRALSRAARAVGRSLRARPVGTTSAVRPSAAMFAALGASILLSGAWGLRGPPPS